MKKAKYKVVYTVFYDYTIVKKMCIKEWQGYKIKTYELEKQTTWYRRQLSHNNAESCHDMVYCFYHAV